MKKLLLLASTLLLCNVTYAEEPEIDVSRLSEAFGHIIGGNLEAPGFCFDLEAIIKGMRDAAEGKESPMTQEEYDRALGHIQRKAFEQLAQQNLEQADLFMSENINHAGIVEIEAGKLQYRINTQGKGQEVTANSSPLVHYTGRYMDGSVFGTSRDGQPIRMPLAQTIPGFRLGMAGMQEGESRTIYVHPELGYGISGQLLPNSLLIFEVEVLEAGEESPSQE